jgi:hypothetical protein
MADLHQPTFTLRRTRQWRGHVWVSLTRQGECLTTTGDSSLIRIDTAPTQSK